MKFEKQYKKINITKVYDLLELKANGRIDADGDYLDDDGNKLTIDCFIDSDNEYDDYQYYYTVVDYNNFDNKVREQMKPVGKKIIGLDGLLRELKDKNGFIIQRKDGARFCEVRDIFLATYEEIE
jgi:hypothetical protein